MESESIYGGQGQVLHKDINGNIVSGNEQVSDPKIYSAKVYYPHGELCLAINMIVGTLSERGAPMSKKLVENKIVLISYEVNTETKETRLRAYADNGVLVRTIYPANCPVEITYYY